jgi:hypothetical protein
MRRQGSTKKLEPAVARRVSSHDYQGGGGQVIDDYYRQMEVYQDEFPDQKKVKRLYDRTLTAIQSIFPEIKKTRWRNRTDFYSLFVALGSILSEEPKRYSSEKIRVILGDFAEQVNERISDEEAKVSEQAADYTAAVQRGSSDKSRRANRHKALLAALGPLFNKKKN